MDFQLIHCLWITIVDGLPVDGLPVYGLHCLWITIVYGIPVDGFLWITC